MRAGKEFVLRNRIDCKEFQNTIGRLQSRKPLHRNPRSTSGKLQKLCTLLLGELAHNFPEPLNNLMAITLLLVSAAVHGVFAPVINVDIWQTTHEKLKLLVVKDRNQMCGDNLVKTLQEHRKLWGETVKQDKLDKQVQILLAVLICNLNISATGFKLNHLGLAKNTACRGKVEVQILNILAFLDVSHTLVHHRVDELNISFCDWEAEQMLIHRARKMRRDNVSIEKSFAHNASKEVEVAHVQLICDT
mmetsp:Transcript_1737/g.4075  ORF Transcript_1737/g.4075 Transcript_1737/m.4075 type:complete len:247 (-) Transcript_1737:1786-2526(-)